MKRVNIILTLVLVVTFFGLTLRAHYGTPNNLQSQNSGGLVIVSSNSFLWSKPTTAVPAVKSITSQEVTKTVASVKSTNPETAYNLTTTEGRIAASLNKPVSEYTIRKCQVIKHTDGFEITFCLARFNGTTGGFYNHSKKLMVVGSLDQYVLIHEITHANTLHFYNTLGLTDMNNSETQEKMAYNAEHLLMQINAFKEDYAYLARQ